VYDKTVRRRRALLVLLVVLSLLLLTAYFGEAPGGRLHGVQRAFLTVVSPIQNGANKALKPVRDTIGWFGDTFHAKSQRDSLRRQNSALRRQLVADQAEKRSLRELQGLYRVDQLGVGNYHPVTATVVGKSPNIWYATVTIDAGSSSGIRVDDPVVNGEGLVGKVAQVASDGAQVDLITDSSMGVSARLAHNGSTGIVQPKVGDPGALLLQYLPSTTQPNTGEYVVTRISLAPNPALMQVLLAQALIATQQPALADEAITDLRTALAHDSDISDGYDYLAMAYGRKGDLAQADLASAQAAFSRGDYKTARQLAARAKTRFPLGTPGWVKADDIATFKPPYTGGMRQ